MSDGITDAYRAAERDRMERLKPEQLSANIKNSFVSIERNVKDLQSMGYTVEINGFKVRIFKEI